MENNIKFNRIRYIELLKKKEFLKTEGTSLFKKNKDENL